MSTCARRFEAEAMRDGRLGGAERASFERHAASCPACSREIAALERLAAALRADDSSPDELRVRRERTRLLAAFDRHLVTPDRKPVLRRAALPVLALGAVAIAFVLLKRPERRLAIANVQSNGAVWSKRIDADRERVVLERGELQIRVEHRAGQQAILVVLPDGELEDTGTTFTVSAEEGHTTRVVVQEGSVVLRLHGQEPRTILAGGEWRRTPTPTVTASVAEEHAAEAHAPTPTTAAPAPSPSPARSAPAATIDASAEFRAAMAALDRGENDRAAAALAAFVAKHPHDSRAEDAAYLRVIALQRAGDVAAMNAAATEYVQRYPDGFRRAEVEALLR